MDWLLRSGALIRQRCQHIEMLYVLKVTHALINYLGIACENPASDQDQDRAPVLSRHRRARDGGLPSEGGRMKPIEKARAEMTAAGAKAEHAAFMARAGKILEIAV